MHAWYLFFRFEGSAARFHIFKLSPERNCSQTNGIRNVFDETQRTQFWFYVYKMGQMYRTSHKVKNSKREWQTYRANQLGRFVCNFFFHYIFDCWKMTRDWKGRSSKSTNIELFHSLFRLMCVSMKMLFIACCASHHYVKVHTRRRIALLQILLLTHNEGCWMVRRFDFVLSSVSACLRLNDSVYVFRPAFFAIVISNCPV